LLLKILRLCRNPRHKIRLSCCREKAFVATLCHVAEYAANRYLPVQQMAKPAPFPRQPEAKV